MGTLLTFANFSVNLKLLKKCIKTKTYIYTYLQLNENDMKSTYFIILMSRHKKTYRDKLSLFLKLTPQRKH